MTCQQRRDLLLLYVSDALDAAETSELLQHLQTGCPECAGYLAEAQAVVGSIPLGLAPVTPPPQLKQKLMARIDADIAAAANPMRLVPQDRDVEAGPMRILRYLIPTAVAAGIAIVCTHSFMMQRVSDLQRVADTYKAESNTATVNVEQLNGKVQSQTQVVEMLRSPDLKVVRLKHSDFQPNAVANLLWDQKRQQWALLTTGMSPAAKGETYELWFVTKAGAVRAGIFDVDSKGTGSLLVNIPPSVSDITLAAVTNEKAGGVDQPHGDFQVSGSVQ